MNWGDFRSWEFDPAFSVNVIVGLGVGFALLAIWREFRGGRRLKPRWFHGVALLARLGAIALLTLILLNPVKNVIVEIPAGRSVILVDRSESMTLGSEDDQTRWEEARSWAEQLTQEAMAARLPVPDTFVFANKVEPGRSDSLPDGKETMMAGALSQLIENAGANAPDEIIIVSDGGAHDRRSLSRALGLAAAQDIPISTRVVGVDSPLRNAAIAAVQAPRIVRPKSVVSVRVDLSFTGFSPDENAKLILVNKEGEEILSDDFVVSIFDDDKQGEPVSIERILTFDAGLRSDSYELTLLAEGDAEVVEEDNRFSFEVEVASSKLRVLFVEGTHVKRSVGLQGHALNDMELMTKAWDATGEIEYTCLTPISEYSNSPNLVGVSFQNGEMRQDPSKTFPLTRDEMFRYDVMLISDVPVGNFSEEQMEWVVEWVLERGGGFLMGGGYTTFDVGNYDKTPWERIIPVDMTVYGDGFFEGHLSIEIPRAVRSHPIWQIAEDPEENHGILDEHTDFTGMNRVRRAKPGALVMATRKGTDGEPVIALQQYGRGRSVAFLPDPNGGWARYYVGWGPVGGPVQGPHTELGHGSSFQFKEGPANAARGPMPAHPSPYYGKFWVNMVRWLGEKSIRWQRDMLAGRVDSVQVRPGKALPISADVLSVSGVENLLALDVGARFAITGSPRVRLEYDRDRREFVGELTAPMELDGDEVKVVFDTTAKRSSLTDQVTIGIQRGNREYLNSAPDVQFMTELADAAGGKSLESVADAVAELRRASEVREANSQHQWKQPVWDQWPFWAVLMSLLGIEWLVRRKGITHGTPAKAAAIGILFFGLMTGDCLRAEEDTPALIEQLGSKRSRLRDEAQQKLMKLPDALEALEEAAESSPDEEVRLRAGNIVKALHVPRWKEVEFHRGHESGEGTLLLGLAVSKDGKTIYTRGNDHLRVWQGSPLKAGITYGAELNAHTGWRKYGPPRVAALSPDGSKMVLSGNRKKLSIYRPESGELLKSWETVPGTTQPLYCAKFFSDSRRLVVGGLGGSATSAQIWDTETEKMLSSIPIPTFLYRVAISPDDKYLALAADRSSSQDYVYIWSMEESRITMRMDAQPRMGCLRFSPDGTTLAGGREDGAICIWKFKDGVASDLNILGNMGGNCSGLEFLPATNSILSSSFEPLLSLAEWDLKTGKQIWKAPPAIEGVVEIRMLNPNQFTTINWDRGMRIWSRQSK